MSDIQDFPSRISDPASRKMETFSYLPELTREEIRKQVEYIVSQGWNPAVEHIEPAYARATYWYMWKLPMFGETDVDRILAEVDACHEANPGNHVRLIGYDNTNQTQGTAMVVYRGTPPEQVFCADRLTPRT